MISDESHVFAVVSKEKGCIWIIKLNHHESFDGTLGQNDFFGIPNELVVEDSWLIEDSHSIFTLGVDIKSNDIDYCFILIVYWD